MNRSAYRFRRRISGGGFIRDRGTKNQTAGISNNMARCLPNEKNSCLLRDDTQEIRLGRVNYCVAGLMSRCSAGTIWNDQQRCKFAEKSTVSNRCMHYIEAIGGHCDCEQAQRELRNTAEIKVE